MGIDQPESDGQKKAETKTPDIYEIKVQGYLDSSWAEWFADMTITKCENGESGVTCTLLSGQVKDQAQLHGLLMKINDLNLKLLSVRRVNSLTNHSEEVPIRLDEL